MAPFSVRNSGASNKTRALQSDAKAKYGVNDGQLYELLNRPFLEEVAGKKLPVRFTHDPTSRDVTPTLEMEYLFLKDAGYVFDPSTKTMFP